MKLIALVRNLIAPFIIVTSVIIYGSISTIICTLFPKNTKLTVFFTSTWSKMVLKLYGVKVKTSGLENIPKDQACAFVFNHVSHIDIPVISATRLTNLRFGAKDELFKIPIFGHALKSFGTIRVYRNQRSKALAEYQRFLDNLKDKRISVILAPEGTRNPNPPLLAPFKSGPFVLAIQGGLPIIPIVLTNIEKVLPKGKIISSNLNLSTEVTLTVLPPVSPANYDFKTRAQLKNKIFNLMTSEIKKELNIKD